MYSIYLMVHVFLISCRPCTGYFFTFSPPAKIEPDGDVIKYVGETLSLNCTAIWSNTTPLTFINLNLNSSQTISNTQRVDNRTIKLDIYNATQNDSGLYNCRGIIEGDSLSSLALKVVLIAYPLEAPVFITCINYDGESMNCSFQLTRHPDEMILQHINISYSIGNANELYLPKQQVTIINNKTIICEWKNNGTNIVNMFNNKLIHNIKIVLYSRIDKLTSHYTIDPYIYVKPGPVKKLNEDFNTSKTLFTTKVEWLPPPNQDACQTGNLVYNVNIIRNNTIVISKKIEPNCNEKNLSLLVNNLVPYTNYTVKVKCKPINDGYWSDEAKLNFTTPITAPKTGPIMLKNFYTTVANPDGFRTVAVYWKDYELDEQGGPIQNYIVTISPLNTFRLIPGIVRSAVTVDLPLEELTVHVQAETEIGSSPTSSLFIPAQEISASPLTVTDVIVEKWNASSYNITWKIGNNHQPTSIKIYYCYSQLSPTVPIVECMTALREPFLIYHDDGAFVILPGTSSRCKGCELYFAVSMNTNTTNNGLIWSICYFDYFGDDAEPIVSVSVDVGSILVKWQRVCSRTKSRPSLLQLSYQQNLYNATCSEGKRVNVSRPQTKYTIKGLNSSTEYLLCLRTFSEVDNSGWILKNITTSPIVTEHEVNYIAIISSVVIVLFVILVCFCVCKIYRGRKHTYVLKKIKREKTDYYTTCDEIGESSDRPIREEVPLHRNRREDHIEEQADPPSMDSSSSSTEQCYHESTVSESGDKPMEEIISDQDEYSKFTTTDRNIREEVPLDRNSRDRIKEEPGSPYVHASTSSDQSYHNGSNDNPLEDNRSFDGEYFQIATTPDRSHLTLSPYLSHDNMIILNSNNNINNHYDETGESNYIRDEVSLDQNRREDHTEEEPDSPSVGASPSADQCYHNGRNDNPVEDNRSFDGEYFQITTTPDRSHRTLSPYLSHNDMVILNSNDPEHTNNNYYGVSNDIREDIPLDRNRREDDAEEEPDSPSVGASPSSDQSYHNGSTENPLEDIRSSHDDYIQIATTLDGHCEILLSKDSDHDSDSDVYKKHQFYS